MFIDETLEKIGLSKNEVAVYLACLKLGPSKAGHIIDTTGMPRATVYDVLESLIQKTLVSITAEGATKKFVAEDPTMLKLQLEKKESELKENQADLERVMSQLKLLKNPHSGIPKVRFYEGFDGMRSVVMDSLRSKTEVLMYVNVEELFTGDEELQKINKEHLEERTKIGLHKKVLALNTKTALNMYKNNYGSESTEIKLLNENTLPFNGGMNIYNNTISYLIFNEKNYYGIIIESVDIYEMQKSLFMMHWEYADNPLGTSIKNTKKKRS